MIGARGTPASNSHIPSGGATWRSDPPGNVNLLIGDLADANREIGVPMLRATRRIELLHQQEIPRADA
jgi:hypothetical protein